MRLSKFGRFDRVLNHSAFSHSAFSTKVTLVFVASLFGMQIVSQAEDRRTPLPTMPMPINQEVYERSLDYHWKSKPVIESHLLDDMETLSTWEHRGFGGLSLTTERAKDGSHSLRLTSPTLAESPGPVIGFPFGHASAFRKVNAKDWTEFDRISFWVYPTLPGFRTIAMTVVLYNEGAEQVPGPHGGRNGRHHILLKPNQWNHCVWEIAHLGRDKVTGVELEYRLQGNEPGATDTVVYDFDRLELQKVEPDYYEGWQVAPGQIAYCHVGYQPDAPKTAFASGLPSTTFSVIRKDTGQPALTKAIKVKEYPTGSFQVLDFSELKQTGTYFLKAGDVQTHVFPIKDDVMRETIIKTINFFYSERCGMPISGIHDICHADWICQHEPTGPKYNRGYQRDRQIIVNGGWHDAGNMAQGTGNTSQAVYAMLELSERLKDDDPVLSDRLIEEATWGLDWLLKTRFGDGYRVHWAPMDFWTDNIIGTVDDVKFKANDSAYNNFVAASAECAASRILEGSDPIRAHYCLTSAEEDWGFAEEKTQEWMQTGVYPGALITNEKYILDAVAAGLLCSIDLYQVTGKNLYRDRAVEYANYITHCQQVQIPEWDFPLTGFFYTNREKAKIYRFTHLSREHAPALGLVKLCRLFPDHPEWMNWYAATALYCDYYKNIVEYTAPYEFFPASIYRVDEYKESRETFRNATNRIFDPESFRKQILNGVKLSDEYYLRLFPVWFDKRGNSSVTLPQAKGLFAAALFRNDTQLEQICRKQLEWNLGLNPFCQSLMYGVGHKFSSMYSTLCGNMIGALPVGIQTHSDKDIPYWPSDVCYNFKEVWVHPSAVWLWLMVDWIDASEKKPEEPAIHFDLVATPKGAGKMTIACRATGSGNAVFELRGWNLEPETQTIDADLSEEETRVIEFELSVVDPDKPCVAVVMPNGDLSQLKDVVLTQEK